MELVAEFTVHGVAKTAGSKKGFYNAKAKRVIITDDTGQDGKAWRSDVRDAAVEKFTDDFTGQVEPINGAVAVAMEITFYRSRPKGHYGSGKNRRFVKDSAPAYPITRPDVDKLSRAILDALKGIAYNDDSQITTKIVRKRYAAKDYTVIKIFRDDAQNARDLPLEERVRGDSFGERAVAQQQLIEAA